MSGDEELKLLDDACMRLGEHFDTVQIFVTRHDNDDEGTVTAHLGHGNWFARRGQISEWLMKSNERSKEIVRHEENEDQ